MSAAVKLHQSRSESAALRRANRALLDAKTPAELLSERPGEYWLISDFFRKKAPFPHTRSHKQGLNVLFRDGHVELVIGQPRAVFK